VAAVRERGEIAFLRVKGHSGDPMNDLVDRLAVEAAASQAGLAE
jgi:ribonuclease HI